MVPATLNGSIVHYILHQAVIRTNDRSMKMRIAYDCPASVNSLSPSLIND